ncbi:MAG: acetylglutamate kinase [Verrucomicrobiales bacterium]
MTSLEEHISKAATLVEALPFIQNFRGQTFLIKVGGSAMEDPDLVRGFLRDIVFLEAVGINPVLVHGGGKAISRAMAEAGLEATFVGGLRVTDEAAIHIVEETLNNEVNPQLVDGLRKFGGCPVGIPGRLVFIGERMKGKGGSGEEVDLGFVGRAVDFKTEEIEAAVSEEIVPVVSPIAAERGTGLPLNVNADIAASALAGRLKASKIIYLSDVLGVMRDPSDPASLIPSLTRAEVEALKADGTIKGGMIPKVDSALEALDAGVGKAHLIDGRIKHSLLLEVFTRVGVGTEIVV